MDGRTEKTDQVAAARAEMRLAHLYLVFFLFVFCHFQICVFRININILMATLWALKYRNFYFSDEILMMKNFLACSIDR